MVLAGLCKRYPTMKAHVIIDGTKVGPYEESQLLAMIESGKVARDTLARRDGTDGWEPLANLMAIPKMHAVGEKNVFRASGRNKLAQELASPRVRLGAVLIDGALMMLPGFTVILGGAPPHSSPDLEMSVSDYAVLVAALALFLVLTAAQIYLLVARGQTIGKVVCGIKIVDVNSGEIPGWAQLLLLRGLLNGLITGIPLIGFFYFITDSLFIFREDRRCIHDHIASTRVVVKG